MLSNSSQSAMIARYRGARSPADRRRPGLIALPTLGCEKLDQSELPQIPKDDTAQETCGDAADSRRSLLSLPVDANELILMRVLDVQRALARAFDGLPDPKSEMTVRCGDLRIVLPLFDPHDALKGSVFHR